MPRETRAFRHDLTGVDRALYETTVQRRLQWDNLIWQVPIVSLTAQAFLFTIALSGGNSQFARAVSSALALVAAVLSMLLMARHRKGEITDAHWIEAYEEDNFGGVTIHGGQWQAARDENLVAGPLSEQPMFRLWMWGFGLFALAAGASLVLALAAPGAFS